VRQPPYSKEEQMPREATEAEYGPQGAEFGAPAPAATKEPPKPSYPGKGPGLPRRTYSVEEAAALAGRSTATVLRHIQAGRLQAHKVGGVGPWVIEAEDLEAWR
jgi:excisionase family DNA binding protein